MISVPPDTIIDDQSQEIVYETTALEEHEQQVETTMDGTSKIISITKKEPTEDQDPNESIKFAVKTRGSANEAPVEFEVELKDQKLIASGQLEDQTQTVITKENSKDRLPLVINGPFSTDFHGGDKKS